MEDFWVLQYPKIVAASRIDFILAHLHYTYGYAFLGVYIIEFLMP